MIANQALLFNLNVSTLLLNNFINIMHIEAINDENSDFESVFIKNKTPHCKKHGAMNKVQLFANGNGAYWRCICSVSKNNQNNCRTGCISYI